MTTTVRPRSPAELAVLVPYQLGYHPGPSVVLTVLRDRRLGMLQRHDLLSDPDACRQAAQQALAIIAHEGATALVVIAFEEEGGSSAPLRQAMLAAADEADLPVREHVVVRGGRWSAPDCDEPCCPEEGLPLPRPEDVPAVAAFVHAGVAPFASREALVDSVLPPGDVGRAREVDLHLRTLGRGAATETFGGAPTAPPWSWLDCAGDVVEGWIRLIDPAPGALPVADLDDAVLARVAASLQDVRWRDLLMGALCPGTMPVGCLDEPGHDLALVAVARCPWTGEGAEDTGGVARERAEEVLAVRTRLVDLVRLLPEHAAPPVLTLIAHLGWWAGDGTVAAVCLERTLAVDPGYRLAELMLRLLSAGVRPWEVDRAAPEAA